MNLVYLSLALVSLLLAAPATGQNPHPKPGAAKGTGTAVATIPKTGPTADIVKACSLAKDKAFCVSSLKAGARGKEMDMKQLMLLAVQMAQDKGIEVSEFVDGKLKQQGTLPVGLEEALGTCSDEYYDAMSQMDDAVGVLLRPGMVYNDMRSWLSGAMLSATVCNKSVIEAGAKTFFPGDANVVFGKRCDCALSVITNMQADALRSGQAKQLS